MRMTILGLGLALVAAGAAPAQVGPGAEQAAAAVNQLGFRLWAQQPRATNVFFSPYSIHQALGLLYIGAAGDTRTQLGRLLGATGDDAADGAAMLALAEALRPRELEDGTAFALSSSNGVFAQEGHAFRPEYFGAVEATFPGAEIRALDYARDAEAARAEINDWVSAETAGTIPSLIEPGVLTALTRLVLANAVYFKAGWTDPFRAELTEDATFTLSDETEVTVPFMHQIRRYAYAEGPEFQAVRIPYLGHQVSAVIVLPRPGYADLVESFFSPEVLNQGLAEATLAEVDLRLPKFQLSPSLPLGDNLKALGLTDAFDPQEADFSGMDGTRDLSVSNALHKAFVKVDEEGTEASAATAIVMGVTSMPAPVERVTMTVDRPFLFLLRDDATGTLLFMGRIADPRG